MQGNSLLEEFDGVRLFDEALIASIPADQTEQIEQIKKKQSELTRKYNQLQAAGQLTKVKEQALDDDLQKQAIILKKLLKYSGPKSDTHDLLGGDSQKKSEELKHLHKTFFEASRRDAKRRIKDNIEIMEWELIEATLKEQDKTDSLKKLGQYKRSNLRPFFLWKFHFAEVFQENGGFDVVIANPPYVRQESIRDIKPQLAKEYGDFYCGTADIYTYFYQRGVDLLKSCGHLCFIAPNKFMRAGYGKSTRVFLTNKVVPKFIIDFGDLPVFDATTYPSIILLEKRKPQGQDKIHVATFTDGLQLDQIEKTLLDIAFPMPLSALKEEGWTLEKPEILALMEKMRRAGKPLGEYVQGRFYYGIKTGLNEAFVIDEDTRKKLIAEDPKSAELIRPWLRGRDIKKWTAEWAGLYLITIPSSANKEWPWSKEKSEAKASLVFAKTYPAIHHHLLQYEDKLRKRDDQGQFWWELRSCAYYDDFDCPKITWGNLATEPKFAFDDSGSYVSAPANIIPTNDLCLLAILNSPISKWWISLQAAVRSGGFLEYKPMYVGEIPIPEVTAAQKAP
ncbi:MAG TPA: hypothetical protein DDZ34_05960, partial [Syntrophaceae bacterium]|nr:hypothetical protein [Syntrophaceae bacterium]